MLSILRQFPRGYLSQVANGNDRSYSRKNKHGAISIRNFPHMKVLVRSCHWICFFPGGRYQINAKQFLGRALLDIYHSCLICCPWYSCVRRTLFLLVRPLFFYDLVDIAYDDLSPLESCRSAKTGYWIVLLVTDGKTNICMFFGMEQCRSVQYALFDCRNRLCCLFHLWPYELCGYRLAF